MNSQEVIMTSTLCQNLIEKNWNSFSFNIEKKYSFLRPKKYKYQYIRSINQFNINKIENLIDSKTNNQLSEPKKLRHVKSLEKGKERKACEGNKYKKGEKERRCSDSEASC